MPRARINTSIQEFHDAVMFQLLKRLRFALKGLSYVFLINKSVLKKLHCNLPSTGKHVACLIDLSHPTCTGLRSDGILPVDEKSFTLGHD